MNSSKEKMIYYNLEKWISDDKMKKARFQFFQDPVRGEESRSERDYWRFGSDFAKYYQAMVCSG